MNRRIVDHKYNIFHIHNESIEYLSNLIIFTFSAREKIEPQLSFLFFLIINDDRR